jgi:hypothetical protein
VTGPRSIESWNHGFADGDHSLEDNLSNGPPGSAENLTEIRELLADDPYLSQKRIAFILNIDQAAVKRIFREDLSLRKFNFNSILHRPDDGQKSTLLVFQENSWNSSSQSPDPRLRKHTQKMKQRFMTTVGNPRCGRI